MDEKSRFFHGTSCVSPNSDPLFPFSAFLDFQKFGKLEKMPLEILAFSGIFQKIRQKYLKKFFLVPANADNVFEK